MKGRAEALRYLTAGLVVSAILAAGVESNARASGSSPSGRALHADSAPCSESAYHALDFTIGDWTVTDSKGNPMGTSEIKPDLGGCVVVENWTAPGGSPKGRNLDGYNEEDKLWRRYFADSRGHVHVFEGVSNGSVVQYQGKSKGPNGRPMLNRLTIRKDGPDKMDQLWEKSGDGGKTWEVAFEGHFTRTTHQ